MFTEIVCLFVCFCLASRSERKLGEALREVTPSVHILWLSFVPDYYW